MKRRHDPRELLLMKRRWLRETEHHIDRNTGEPKRPITWWREDNGKGQQCYMIDYDAPLCTCLRGYGYFRKIRQEGVERGSGWKSFHKRMDRRCERYMARPMIREQMVEGMPLTQVGRRRVGFHLDYLD